MRTYSLEVISVQPYHGAERGFSQDAGHLGSGHMLVGGV